MGNITVFVETIFSYLCIKKAMLLYFSVCVYEASTPKPLAAKVALWVWRRRRTKCYINKSLSNCSDKSVFCYRCCCIVGDLRVSNG